MARRILIAEDDEDVLEAIRLNLELDGHDVDVTRHGDAVLDRVRELQPDLLLLDIVMPGVDGVEVCRRLKRDEHARDVPVIFLTAKTTTHDLEVGMAAGAVDYIVKPFEPRDLLERVRRRLPPDEAG